MSEPDAPKARDLSTYERLVSVWQPKAGTGPRVADDYPNPCPVCGADHRGEPMPTYQGVQLGPVHLFSNAAIAPSEPDAEC